MADHDPRPSDLTGPANETGTGQDTEADKTDAANPATDAVILPDPDSPAMPRWPQEEEADAIAALPHEPPARPDRPETPTRPETVAPKTVAAPRRSGLVGMVAGGLIAAGLGYGLAIVVPDGWPIADTAAIDAQLASQTTEITALKGELAALAARPAGIGEDRFAAVETTVQTLRSAPAPATDPRIDTLGARLSALEAAPGRDGGVSPAALAGYQAELANLRAELDAQKGAGAAMVTDIEAAAKAAETRLAEAEAQAATLRSEAEATALAATTAAGFARVQAALDSGASFAGPLADLEAAGLEVPIILTDAAETGLPTIAALQASFAEAARVGLESSIRVDMGDSLTERMGSFIRSQTGARSLVPREGSDPDAVLSRAEAALAANDLPATLTELATLPPEGQAAMADWIAQAQRRIDATQAVAALATAVDAL